MKSMNKNKIQNPKTTYFFIGSVTCSMLSCLLTPVSFANVVGSDMQNFNATTNGIDFVTVESAETLRPGFVNFGLFMNYAVNTLPYFDQTETIQSRTKFNDSVLGADLNVGYGVAPNFDIGLSLPQIVTSSVKTKTWNGKFSDNGNTEVRLNGKYKLVGDEKEGIAIQGVVNFNRTKDNPYVGDSNAPIYSLVLIASRQVTDEMGVGANLGYRWRKAGAAIPAADPIKPLPNQYIWSAALNYRVSSLDSKIIGEIFGSAPVNRVSTNSDRTASSAESLIGIKHDLDTNTSIHGGFGTELTKGLSSPDWRIYIGVNYALGPKAEAPAPVPAPAAPPPAPEAKVFDVPPQAYEKIVVNDIMFEFDSDHLVLGASKDMLKALGEHLKKPPTFTKLVVVGHTDDIGSAEYNDQLSKRRAETIKKYLVNNEKIDANKIIAEGHGEREPVASNSNFQGRQQNRRVEFRIYREGEKEEIRSSSNADAAKNAKDPIGNGPHKKPKKSGQNAPVKVTKPVTKLKPNVQ